MFNLLKSDLYRLVRSKLLWGYLIVAVALYFLVAGMGAFVASPEFAHMVVEADDAPAASAPSAPDAAMDPADQEDILADAETLGGMEMTSLSSTWSQTFFSGGFLGVMSSALAVLFLFRDFDHGFVRTLPMGRRGRWRYYGEKLILSALITAGFTLFSAAFTTIAFAAFGFSYLGQNAVGELALWLLLVWLVATAYCFICNVIMWMTRTKWMGPVAAIAISSTMVGSFLVAAAEIFKPAFPALQDLCALLPVGAAKLLSPGAQGLLAAGQGTLAPWLCPAAQIAATALLWLVVFAIIALTACRRRDL